MSPYVVWSDKVSAVMMVYFQPILLVEDGKEVEEGNAVPQKKKEFWKFFFCVFNERENHKRKKIVIFMMVMSGQFKCKSQMDGKESRVNKIIIIVRKQSF